LVRNQIIANEVIVVLFSKILVAYDGSNLSRKALDKAVKLVQDESNASKAPILEVIHVYSFPNLVGSEYVIDSRVAYLDYAQTVIEEAKELIPSTLQAKFIILQGQPAFSILNYVEENNIDLIIMGSRGLGTIREFFLGSVSHNIVQNAKIPVLVVK
jgi:nucleotide-binding universal stress UspA family protein